MVKPVDELIDRTALVTGAGKGTGRRVALALAEAGVRVAANDINPANLAETLSTIQNRGGAGQAFPTDIANRMAVQLMFDQIVEAWGQLDIVVHAACVDPAYDLLDLDEWDWQRALNVNLGGAFLVMQIGGRLMQQAAGGVILTIDPTLRATPPLDKRAAYWASQAGLEGLTRAAASEFGAYNIVIHHITAADELSTDSQASLQGNAGIAPIAIRLCLQAIRKSI